MSLPTHKTKIVCTIGPASESPAVMEQLIHAGMNVARLNFSHGGFEQHRTVIANLRAAAQAVGRRVAILADLPGPKMRIGKLDPEPVELKAGDSFTLTTAELVGDGSRASVTFAGLPKAVKPGDALFLNDGIIQLAVVSVAGDEVRCRVVVGGELRSRKGLNLPGIELGIRAFTDRDHECLKFALEHGVDAVSQSFVETAADIKDLRRAAEALGRRPFLVAKIERAGALNHFDEIVQAADGIMIARGDLGVEIPIEQMAVVQKRLMEHANRLGQPVITATQMLESMVENRRPTRAEATDVANAILDGTDAVMLSAESAMGKFPVEATAMLGKIAAATEPCRRRTAEPEDDGPTRLVDLVALNVRTACERIAPAAVIVPTASGRTARMVARFKLPVWVVAVSPVEATCMGLQLSYGVCPVHRSATPDDWKAFARDWLREQGLSGNLVLLTQGPSALRPEVNHRMEILELANT